MRRFFLLLTLFVGISFGAGYYAEPYVVHAQSLGGTHHYSGSVGATKTAVKTTAGVLYSWCFYNSNSSAAYVQIFDKTSANVTLGTTAPDLSIGIPATTQQCMDVSSGVLFYNAITYAVTTTRAGSTTTTNTVDVNFFYD